MVKEPNLKDEEKRNTLISSFIYWGPNILKNTKYFLESQIIINRSTQLWFIPFLTSTQYYYHKYLRKYNSVDWEDCLGKMGSDVTDKVTNCDSFLVQCNLQGKMWSWPCDSLRRQENWNSARMESHLRACWRNKMGWMGVHIIIFFGWNCEVRADFFSK